MMESEAQDLAVNIGGVEAAASPGAIAAISIAISLKRIADALNYQPIGNETIYDLLRRIADKDGF